MTEAFRETDAAVARMKEARTLLDAPDATPAVRLLECDQVGKRYNREGSDGAPDDAPCGRASRVGLARCKPVRRSSFLSMRLRPTRHEKRSLWLCPPVEGADHGPEGRPR